MCSHITQRNISEDHNARNQVCGHLKSRIIHLQFLECSDVSKVLSVLTSRILSIFSVDMVLSYCSCQLLEMPSCSWSVVYSYTRKKKDLKPVVWSIGLLKATDNLRMNDKFETWYNFFRFHVSFLTLCCPNTWRLKYIELQFCLLFRMGVKLDLSHCGRNIDCGCSRIGCWGRNLWLRGRRRQGFAEGYIKRSCMLCIPHHLFFGWWN